MPNKIVETDVLIVGGGPAGLATAVHCADQIRIFNESIDSGKNKGAKITAKIMVLEKASSPGNHTLSGAVINPKPFQELLPDIALKDMPFDCEVTKDEVCFLAKEKHFTLPFHPPYMNNRGNYVASMGNVVRWLGEIAEKKGIQVFSGFSAHEVLYENNKVVGVRTGVSGVNKEGHPMANFQPANDVKAKITIFAEGTRGHLAKTVISKLQLDKDRNPQVYSLGVKEIWQVPAGAFEAGRVLHTMGFPLEFDQFGGGFIYGLKNNLVVIGLVVGLDYQDPYFDPHHAFQIYKKHPLISSILKDGKMLRYGAKTIPEGGYFAIPQLYHDNMLIVGDSAGLLAMPSLKGVHLAVQSGILAAKTIVESLKVNNTSANQLSMYDELFKESLLQKELYPVRNFRQGFQSNLFMGMLHFGAQLATGGHGLSLNGRLTMEPDYTHYHPASDAQGESFLKRNKKDLVFDKVLTFDKEMDVFFSGTKHDEEQPTHIVVPNANICQECVEKYDAPCQRFCPAQVFEIVSDTKTAKRSLQLHPSNCVHCKTCDIKDPYENVLWVTPYGGDGPEYDNM